MSSAYDKIAACQESAKTAFVGQALSTLGGGIVRAAKPMLTKHLPGALGRGVSASGGVSNLHRNVGIAAAGAAGLGAAAAGRATA